MANHGHRLDEPLLDLTDVSPSRSAHSACATSQTGRHLGGMTKRSPVTVVILSLITFGIYALIWQVQTKNEMNRAYGAGIPTAWLILVPFVGALYWLWKWSEGAEKATGMSTISVFLLMILVPIVGIPVLASKFNEAKPAMPLAVPMRMVA
jgi:cytochrome bd-type quinol oxidase subunit 2